MRARSDPTRLTFSIVGVFGLLVILFVSMGAAAGLGVSPAAVTPTWHRIFPVNYPPPGRNWPAMAYDPAIGSVLLYGGYDGGKGRFYHDTWTYTGGNWTHVIAKVHPSADSGLQLVYDPAVDGVVAFGGEAPYGSQYYNDTWVFANGAWHELNLSRAPSPRSQYSMTYDSYDQEIVLFGGHSASGAVLSDTWVFNGTAWSEVNTSRSPIARENGQMVFDPTTNQTLLFGGYNPAYSVGGQSWSVGNSTWAFKSGIWTNLNATGNPPAMSYPYLTNLGNGTPVLFGGQTPGYPVSYYNATYEFYGNGWHLIRSGFPSGRANGGFVYDAKDGYDFLFGGKTASGRWSNVMYRLD